MNKKEPVQQPLLAEEAAIQERSVTIRVLTIGTKQITQTLYRQLVEEHILNNQGQMKGMAWGWVNVHTDCTISSKHLHVVWEKDGVLKRCAVKLDHEESAAYIVLKNKLHNAAEAYVNARALEGNWFRTAQNTAVSASPLRIKMDDLTITVHYNYDAIHSYQFRRDVMEQTQEELEILLETSQAFLPTRDADIERKREQLTRVTTYCNETKQAVLAKVLAVTGPLDEHDLTKSTVSQTLYQTMKEIDASMRSYENTWRNSYRLLEKSGQLFIAVSGVWK